MTKLTYDKKQPKIKPSKILYKESYGNTLSTVRKHYKTSKNTLSRFLHAKGMDELHEFLTHTLVHPKILLSAAISTLIGEVISVYMAEIYGYSYNYLLFIYFFLLGYLLSIIYFTIFAKLKK
jgi:hypothetical protein